MKKAFTLLEVSVLFCIFIVIAFIVIPISIDDTNQMKNIADWKSFNAHFMNLFSGAKLDNDLTQFEIIVRNSMSVKEEKVKPYKTHYLNREKPESNLIFDDLYKINSGSIIGFKWFKGKNDSQYGFIMYDTNGKKLPNTWGKDIFGFSITKDQIMPLCQNESLEIMRSDCSKFGRGVCCSYYYIIGGDF